MLWNKSEMWSDWEKNMFGRGRLLWIFTEPSFSGSLLRQAAPLKMSIRTPTTAQIGAHLGTPMRRTTKSPWYFAANQLYSHYPCLGGAWESLGVLALLMLHKLRYRKGMPMFLLVEVKPKSSHLNNYSLQRTNAHIWLAKKFFFSWFFMFWRKGFCFFCSRTCVAAISKSHESCTSSIQLTTLPEQFPLRVNDLKSFPKNDALQQKRCWRLSHVNHMLFCCLVVCFSIVVCWCLFGLFLVILVAVVVIVCCFPCWCSSVVVPSLLALLGRPISRHPPSRSHRWLPELR